MANQKYTHAGKRLNTYLRRLQPIPRNNPQHHVWARKFKECMGSQPFPHLKRCSEFSSLHKLQNLLSENHSTTCGEITPKLALRLQKQCKSEIAFDRVIDHRAGRVFGMVTRGCDIAVASDAMYYYSFSPRFFVWPIFHTHQTLSSDIGPHLPSTADYIHLKALLMSIGRRRIESSVYFPDGRRVIYSVVSTGRRVPLYGFRKEFKALARYGFQREFTVYPDW